MVCPFGGYHFLTTQKDKHHGAINSDINDREL